MLHSVIVLLISCTGIGFTDPMLLLTPEFALASAWKQARSNWSYNAVCRMVQIHR